MLNSRAISDLRPDVAANCRTLLMLCKQQGLNVLVTQTMRDNEYQAALYAHIGSEPERARRSSEIAARGNRPCRTSETAACGNRQQKT